MQNNANKQTMGTMPTGSISIKSDIQQFCALLSVRASHVIQTLKIDSLEDLLLLDEDKLRKTRNCGRKTTHEILKLRNSMFHSLLSNRSKLTFAIPIEEWYKESASTERLHHLPIYSNTKIDSIPLECFHSSYCATEDVNALSLTVRAKNVINKYGITTIGELLLTQCDELLTEKNCGRKTIRDIQISISNHIFKTHLQNSGEVLSAIKQGYEYLISYYLELVLKNKRNSEILAHRLNIFSEKKETLESVGAHYKLTRERVRQIEAKLLGTICKPAKLKILSPFWEVVDETIKRHGILEVSHLAVILQERFSWAKPPPYHSLTKILAWRPDTLTISNKYVFVKGSACQLCPSSLIFICDHIKSNPSVTVDSLKDSLSQNCSHTCKSAPALMHTDFITYKLNNDDILKKLYKIKDNIILPYDEYQFRYGSTTESIRIALKRASKACHFTEVANATSFRKTVSNNYERYVHAVLTNIKEALLWDRGTFIHRDVVTIPRQLITEISTWIKSNTHKAPFVTVYNIFKQYKDQCIENHIPSETALYTCLREISPKGIYLPRYPYILLQDQERQSPAEMLENYLFEAGEEVSLEQVKHYLINEIGLKEMQFNEAIGSASCYVRSISGGFIHEDVLSIDYNEFKHIVSYIKDRLLTTKHISAEMLYKEKGVTCKMCGISDSRILYSVLQNHYSSDFTLKRYPLISLPSHGATRDINITVLIEEYIRNKDSMCPYSDLENEFINKRGFSPHTLAAVVYNSSKLCRYVSGSILHIDTIKWCLEKETALIELLKYAFEGSLRANRYYGRLEDVLEYNEAQLPAIPDNFIWTTMLVYELTKRLSSLKYIGNKRNAYIIIPNSYDARSFEDIVYLLLSNQFHGATSIDELTEYLKNERVIEKNISEQQLSAFTKVFHDSSTLFISG